jgi:hypothetical protein
LRQVFGGRKRWWEWGCPWGWPCVLSLSSFLSRFTCGTKLIEGLSRPGDGQTFPINEEHLAQLRRITEEVYAEAAAGRHEERTYELGDDESSASEEDGPVRRA